jgi:hypothetical protein
MLSDIERSVTALIEERGTEGAVAWIEKRARALFESGDQDGGAALLWFARVIRRRGDDPAASEAHRRYRGDL